MYVIARLSARPAAQSFGNKKDDQGIQAPPLLLGLGGEPCVDALRNPLDPFPAQSRRWVLFGSPGLFYLRIEVSTPEPMNILGIDARSSISIHFPLF